MDEDDRRKLYGTLLRGLANDAQDRMCAADTGHAWGPWVRYQIRHDLEDAPLRFGALEPNRKLLIAARRCCENCGKEQRD